jgi:Flp pilus assembly pilin Flp
VLIGTVQIAYGVIAFFVNFLVGTLVPMVVTVFRTIWTVISAFRTGWVFQWIAIHAAAAAPWIGLALLITAALVAVASVVYRFRDTIKTAFLKIVDFFKWVGDQWRDKLTAPFVWIWEKLLWLRDKMADLMEKLSPGFIAAMDTVSAAIKTKVDAVADKLKESLGAAWEWTKDKAGESVDAIKIKYDELKAKISDFMSSLKTMGASGMVDIKLPELDAPKLFDEGAIEKWESQMVSSYDRIADMAKAVQIEIAHDSLKHTTLWRDASLELARIELEKTRQMEGASQVQRMEARLKYADEIARIEMEYDDAVLENWMLNHKTMINMMRGLEAMYDTFFESLAEQEMTGKERREQMWEDGKKAFLTSTADMFKEYIKMYLKNLLLGDLMELKFSLRRRSLEARIGAIKAYQAFASIPVIGPVLGAAAAAAAFTFLMAFHKGGMVNATGNAAKDERIVRVQAGEYIVQKSAVSRLGRSSLDYMNATGKTPAVTPVANFNIVVNAGSDAAELREAIEDRVVPVLEDLVRRKRLLLREAA